MKKFGLKAFISTALIFTVLDLLWIGFLGGHLYYQYLGNLLRYDGQQLNAIWWAALLVYLLLIAGIMLFTQETSHPIASTWRGAQLGLVIYGVYDLTNYALLKNWPLTITLVDIIWGTFLCAMTAGLTRFIARR